MNATRILVAALLALAACDDVEPSRFVGEYTLTVGPQRGDCDSAPALAALAVRDNGTADYGAGETAWTTQMTATVVPQEVLVLADLAVGEWSATDVVVGMPDDVHIAGRIRWTAGELVCYQDVTGTPVLTLTDREDVAHLPR